MTISTLSGSEDLRLLAEYDTQALLHSRPRQDKMDSEKSRVLAEIRDNLGPAFEFSKRMHEYAYGYHPLRAKPLSAGTIDGVESITLEDIIAWKDRGLQPQLLHWVLAGDVRYEDIAEHFANEFGSVPRMNTKPFEFPPLLELSAPKTFTTQAPDLQKGSCEATIYWRVHVTNSTLAKIGIGRALFEESTKAVDEFLGGQWYSALHRGISEDSTAKIYSISTNVSRYNKEWYEWTVNVGCDSRYLDRIDQVFSLIAEYVSHLNQKELLFPTRSFEDHELNLYKRRSLFNRLDKMQTNQGRLSLIFDQIDSGINDKEPYKAVTAEHMAAVASLMMPKKDDNHVIGVRIGAYEG